MFNQPKEEKKEVDPFSFQPMSDEVTQPKVEKPPTKDDLVAEMGLLSVNDEAPKPKSMIGSDSKNAVEEVKEDNEAFDQLFGDDPVLVADPFKSNIDTFEQLTEVVAPGTNASTQPQTFDFNNFADTANEAPSINVK